MNAMGLFLARRRSESAQHGEPLSFPQLRQVGGSASDRTFGRDATVLVVHISGKMVENDVTHTICNKILVYDISYMINIKH